MLSQSAFGIIKQHVRRGKKKKEHRKYISSKHSLSYKLSSNSETEAGNGVTRGHSHLTKAVVRTYWPNRNQNSGEGAGIKREREILVFFPYLSSFYPLDPPVSSSHWLKEAKMKRKKKRENEICSEMKFIS